MEVDLTIISEEELNYWCKEYPDLDREEVRDILEVIDITSVKEDFWKENPQMSEEDVNSVVAQNAFASHDYHLYMTYNNEAQ